MQKQVDDLSYNAALNFTIANIEEASKSATITKDRLVELWREKHAKQCR
jgi:hypothetical protein